MQLHLKLVSNAFEVFIKECLLPKLWPGAVVVMDNVPAHKKTSIESLIQSVGASVLNLSPYSPDFKQDRTLVVTTKSFFTPVFS